MNATMIDITRTLGPDTVGFPGDADFSISQKRTDCFTLSEISMGSHSGTHIDAPRHYFDEGESIDAIPIARFFLAAEVVAIKSRVAVTVAELADCSPEPGVAILFKTANSNLSRERFHKDFVYIDPDVARWLLERKVPLVGIDYLSVERYDDADFPVHRMLLGAGVLILEDIDLSLVTPGRYQLVCLPLKIAHADGAPCRAVLRRAQP